MDIKQMRSYLLFETNNPEKALMFAETADECENWANVMEQRTGISLSYMKFRDYVITYC